MSNQLGINDLYTAYTQGIDTTNEIALQGITMAHKINSKLRIQNNWLLEESDVTSCVGFAIVKSLKAYKDDKGVRYSTFLYNAIKQELYNFNNKLRSLKGSSISSEINDIIEVDENFETSHKDKILDLSIDKLDLPDLDKHILKLLSKGNSAKDICEITGLGYHTVYGRIRMIRGHKKEYIVNNLFNSSVM